MVMRLLSPRGSHITTTTVAGTSNAMIMTRERCLLVLEFFVFVDLGLGFWSATWASRVDFVLVSICVSRSRMLILCMMYGCILAALVCFVCIPNYYVMVRCNDIHLEKVCQYAVLSLVGPSSSFRIESHIGRDIVILIALLCSL